MALTAEQVISIASVLNAGGILSFHFIPEVELASWNTYHHHFRQRI
jgi:hypothetical protein